MSKEDCTQGEACEYLQECKADVDRRLEDGDSRFDNLCDKIDLLLERHDEMAADIAKMSEILVAWNSIKGFVSTLTTVSKLFRWLVLTGAAVGAVWYFLIHGAQPPK